MTVDFALAVSLFAGVAVGAGAWFAIGRRRAGRIERVDRGGGSAWLPQSTQRGGYWIIEPLGRAIARAGISANMVTLASIPLALGAGAAFADGHFGIGAALAALAFLCDTLDGIVARAHNAASDAGEIVDAASDRVCEALLFGGLTLRFHAEPILVAIVLAAALGAQQVTYASAKAEIYRVDVPRGSMRRAERAVYLVTAAAATALIEPFVRERWAMAPLLLGLVLIAVVGNGSAVLRFAAIARALRERDRRNLDPHAGAPHAAE